MKLSKFINCFTNASAASGKRSSISTKAGRARIPFMLVITSLAFLIVPLQFLRSGLNGIVDIVGSQLSSARLDLAALQGSIDQKVRAHHKLERLTATSLPPISFETHTECLRRGIHIASAHFLNQEYVAVPAIGNGTVEWVENNCGRLFFAPTSHSTRSWQFREHFKIVADLLGQTVNRWFRTVKKSIPKSRPRSPQDTFNLPPHFHLDECHIPPCKLSFILPTNHVRLSPSQHDIDAANNVTKNLEEFMARFQLAFQLSDTIYDWTTKFQALLSIAWLIAEYSRLNQAVTGIFDSTALVVQLIIVITIQALVLSIRFASECTAKALSPSLYVAVVVVGILALVAFRYVGITPLVSGMKGLVAAWKGGVMGVSVSRPQDLVASKSEEHGGKGVVSIVELWDLVKEESEHDWEIVENAE